MNSSAHAATMILDALYNGLHSLNFPWLYNQRLLWDIVVITFMLAGPGLCVTSLVLAWRAVGRKLAAASVLRVRQPSVVQGERYTSPRTAEEKFGLQCSD